MWGALCPTGTRSMLSCWPRLWACVGLPVDLALVLVLLVLLLVLPLVLVLVLLRRQLLHLLLQL